MHIWEDNFHPSKAPTTSASFQSRSQWVAPNTSHGTCSGATGPRPLSCGPGASDRGHGDQMHPPPQAGSSDQKTGRCLGETEQALLGVQRPCLPLPCRGLPKCDNLRLRLDCIFLCLRDWANLYIFTAASFLCPLPRFVVRGLNLGKHIFGVFGPLQNADTFCLLEFHTRLMEQ